MAISDTRAGTGEPGPRIRVDWTIPVWSVVGLVAQALAIAWWGATLQARVTALEASAQANAALPATVARLDERSAAQSEALKRVEEQLNRLGARQ